MMRKTKKTSVTVSPGSLLHLALLLLVLPIRWVVAFLAAAFVHELGHIFAMKRMGIPILRIHIGLHGAEIETGIMNTWQEMLCVVSGPLAGAATILLKRQFPTLALCGFVQTMYNLIPIYPSDGGRLLRCLLSMLFPQEQTQRVCMFLTYGLLVFGALTAVCLFRFESLGILPGICLVVIVTKFVKQKNSLQR